MPHVTFSVRCDRTQWGESVSVLGSWINWDQSRLVRLSTAPDRFPQWSVKVTVDDGLIGQALEYKYVISRDGQITRWEYDRPQNRTLVLTGNESTSDRFGQAPNVRSTTEIEPHHQLHPPDQDSRRWSARNPSEHHFPDVDMNKLDALEKAIVQHAKQNTSWRLRLSFVRSLFTDDNIANSVNFKITSISALATLSIYLSFLSTGQLPCGEDGSHHRPNHHANEARRIEAALPAAIQHAVGYEFQIICDHDKEHRNQVYVPYVVRKIFPLLPSYSSQFTVSVPLTRIRDIAHRNDIPHDLKQDIKHNLQNKLHRSAGPEDLHTSERLLKKISHGGFSQPFVDQFRIFHEELKAFFNAASLDERLRYLQCCEFTRRISASAGVLLGLKTQHADPLLQLRALTELRTGISQLALMQQNHSPSDEEQLPHEDVQKVRLADIDLEGYSFVLLASEAKEVETQSTPSSFHWQRVLEVLSIAMKNLNISCIRPVESLATAAELSAVSDLSASATRTVSTTLRAKAAVERALRFLHEFSDSIVDIYTRRAQALGEALGVAKQAVDVFAEAEVRSSICFQASRIATACMSACRKALNFPPWDALYVGKATGHVIYTEELADAFKSNNPNGNSIVVCRSAKGDEDVPSHVRGIIGGRALPHLSHLGVRVRQAGVVFVCAEERSVFDSVWKQRLSGYCELGVTSREGLATWRELSLDSENGEPDARGDSRDEKVEIKSEEEDGPMGQHLSFDNTCVEVIPVTKATRDLASSKCMHAGVLFDVAINSDGLFGAPNGVAIPHGVFQQEKERHSKEYLDLVKDYDSAAANGGDSDTLDKAIMALQRFIEKDFKVEEEVIAKVQDAFPRGTKLMIRSSTNAEDLERMSGAGLYDTIANVEVDSAKELEKSIKKVWASLWTKRAGSSRVTYGVKHDQVSMAVLVQEMIRSDMSFVAFSKEPAGHGSKVYVEVAVGMGETLASAVADGSPYKFRVDRGDFDVEQVSYASYSTALVPEDATQGALCPKVVDYSKEWMTTSDDSRTDVVRRIATAVIMLEDVFDGPQDVEGAIKSNSEGEIDVYIVQSRPQII